MPKYDFVPQAVIFLDYGKLESLLEEFYELTDSIELCAELEWSNDEDHVILVNGADVSAYDEREAAEFVTENGHVSYPALSSLMSIMAQADFIPSGKYVVEVSW